MKPLKCKFVIVDEGRSCNKIATRVYHYPDGYLDKNHIWCKDHPSGFNRWTPIFYLFPFSDPMINLAGVHSVKMHIKIYGIRP